MIRNLVTLVCLGASALAQNYYAATLGSAQEVPVNGSSATVWGIIRNDVGTDLVHIFVHYEGQAGSAASAHMHLGLPGTNGGVVVALTAIGTNTLTGQANIGVVLTPAHEAGAMYLNLHSTGFPGGEIRGQVVVATAQCFIGRLDGGQ